MTLTGPPSGKDDDTGLGYDDTPAGNIWRQTAGPVTPELPGRVARTCHGHRWLTLSGWAAIAACLIIMWMRRAAGQQLHRHRPGHEADQPALPAPVG